MPKYAVLTVVDGKWENTWTETIDGTSVPLEFDSSDLAQHALDEFKSKQENAGEAFNPNEYLVCELMQKKTHKLR